MSDSTIENGRPVVFRGGTVLTMNDAHDVLHDADVLVVGDKIAGVGPGLEAPGTAQPAWRVLARLAEKLGGGPVPERADVAFLRAAERAPALRGITYEDLATAGALLNQPAAPVGSGSTGGR